MNERKSFHDAKEKKSSHVQQSQTQLKLTGRRWHHRLDLSYLRQACECKDNGKRKSASTLSSSSALPMKSIDDLAESCHMLVRWKGMPLNRLEIDKRDTDTVKDGKGKRVIWVDTFMLALPLFLSIHFSLGHLRKHHSKTHSNVHWPSKVCVCLHTWAMATSFAFIHSSLDCKIVREWDLKKIALPFAGAPSEAALLWSNSIRIMTVMIGTRSSSLDIYSLLGDQWPKEEEEEVKKWKWC